MGRNGQLYPTVENRGNSDLDMLPPLEHPDRSGEMLVFLLFFFGPGSSRESSVVDKRLYDIEEHYIPYHAER
jgi:hypothetical protein